MIFTFRIKLLQVSKPPVWRVVQVPAQFSFARFHEVIQAAFGWWNYHLYEFIPGKRILWAIGIPSDEDWQEVKDARKIKLSEIFDQEGQKLVYVYDFGDYWQHQVTLEAISDKNVRKAQLIDGKGLCPHEDCGGVPGYQYLKEVMADPSHEEYDSMREWLDMDEDEVFDPAYFNLEETQENVRQV